MTDSATNPLTDPLADPLGESLSSFAKGVWWWVLIRGILAVAFGVIALIAPAIALTAIAIVFGAYALVDGVMLAIHAVQVRGTYKQWGWLLAQGIISALAGLAALILPGLAGALGGLFVLWTIVFYSIMNGVAGLMSAAGAHSGSARTTGIIAGILSIVFGIVLGILVFVTPGATLLGLVWAVGIYAIVFGITLVVTAIQVRIARNAAQPRATEPKVA